MHEVSIMAEAVRLAVESAQTAGARRITALRLRVGKLSGAVPEAMMFAWDIVRQDTVAANATLTIETVAAACWCVTCKAEFVCEDFISECPRCHDCSGKLLRGWELEIANMEIE